MLTDIGSILVWWGTIFVVGILGLPFILVLFHKFWDKGYIFSKIFSLITITYVILVLGIFKILPFTLISLFILFLLFLVFNFFFLRNKQNLDKVIESFQKNYKIFIFQELLFLILIVSWSLIRGFAPNIEGLEKYMDWGFVNSSLRSKFLPPQDMWFANLPINYYYFGHLIFALITKFSGIPSAITYNLSIATVFSLTFLSSFSLSSNIVFLFFKKINFQKIILAGLISSLLLTFGGNLHSVYKIIRLNVNQNNNHLNLSQQSLTKSIDSYWYPDATRFIGHDPDTKDKTIHEFPIYSFVVADLHGHMNDIPIVLFFLAVLFVLTINSSSKINWLSDLFFGFILSICYMTNAWDFAVYGLFFAVFTILLNFQRDGPISLTKSIINGGLVIIFWYLFSLPFSINFTPMMEGLRLTDSHTLFYQLYILYGGFWLISFPFLIYFLVKRPKDYSAYFIFSLIIVATILVLIPEVIYIKDIYIYEYRRANTMFKLVYQAFILYSIASGCILIYISKFLKSKILTSIYKIIFSIIFVIHLIYPYFAIKSFYGSKQYVGLNGLNYLKDLYPDNFNAINWINQNISGQPVMLEAVGDSYTTFNQISSATGLPTVEGWIVHEWLWRGGYDQPASREKEVETVYKSSDLEKVKEIIKKYNIEYLFVGAKEYEKYGQIDINRFEKIGAKIVFKSGKTTIFRL